MVEMLFSGAGITIASVAPAPMWVFHCAAADAATIPEMGLAMLRSVERDGGAALHLAPDEWLLIGGEPVAAAAAHALVDVADRSLGVDVSGSLAAAVLNAACPLDLDVAVFPDGACTRTLFGKADVVVWRRGDGFRLYYGRSFAPYVTAMLVDAARHSTP